MKTISLEKIELEAWIKNLQAYEQFILTHNRRPVALVVGVNGLDREQVELGASDKFWRMITERREGKTITRAELEERLKRHDAEKRRARKAASNGRKSAKAASEKG